jgi:hypothetical protein
LGTLDSFYHSSLSLAMKLSLNYVNCFIVRVWRAHF